MTFERWEYPEEGGDPPASLREVYLMAKVIEERLSCFGKIPGATGSQLQAAFCIMAAVSVVGCEIERSGRESRPPEQWEHMIWRLFNETQEALREEWRRMGGETRIVNDGLDGPGLKPDRN
jgi:hypothetical protein